MMEKLLMFILFVIIASGIGVAYYYLEVTVLEQELDSVQVKIRDVQKAINDSPVIEKQIENSKVELQRINEEWKKLRKKVNIEIRIPKFIREIKKYCEETKTELRVISIDNLSEYEEYDVLPISITVNGPYHNIGRFIARMENLRLVNARTGKIALTPYKASRTVKNRRLERSFGRSGEQKDKTSVQLSFSFKSYIFKGGDFETQ